MEKSSDIKRVEEKDTKGLFYNQLRKKIPPP